MMRSTQRFSFVLAMVFLAVPAAVQAQKADDNGAKKAAPSAQRRVPEGIRLLMQSREYAKAITAIVAAEKKADMPLDYLAYSRGRALHLLKKYDEAAAAFAEVEKKFPKSPWARRARFARAISFMRKGDFRNAELIYRNEAKYLLSVDRKQQIADIYLQFAGTFFKPKDLTKKPDFKKALTFYQKALQVGPKPDKQQEVELLVARCYQSLKNYAAAAQHLSKFIKQHEDSPLLVEARFRLGECQLAQNQNVAARRTWQDLLAAHADDKSPRIAEAQYNLAKTYRIPAPNNNDELSLGVAALEAFLKKHAEHKLASTAHLNIAASYIHRGRYEDAAAALKRFLGDDRHTDCEEVPEARYVLGRAYQLQKKYTEALVAWRDYLTKHPAHKQWGAAQRDIVNTEYLLGDEQRAEKNYAKARQLWTAFLDKYPLDGRSRTILYLFGDMNFRQDKWEAAIADWQRLVAKYPGTNESSRAQYMIALVTEEKLGKLDDALKEYRKVTWGSSRSAARQRISRLTRKSLTIATERVFRGNETPVIKLTARNIEDVKVEIYTVDLETYFRKMHLARGVEGLDIALIDPDQVITHKIEGYEQYKLTEGEIKIALPASGDLKAPKAGVLAVTVSSKTLEATTMLLQSDLDVIVKSSRNEVFVLAENMRTGKPWKGVRLLLSNGKEVFAEGTTGDDGVFQKSFKELKSADDVRVFAVADGSVASNVVSLSGVGVARGLADKGYIYTDRPAYRAGQMVHIRGVMRRVVDDTYTIEKGKKYTVEVFDGRNRQLRRDEVVLSDLGSFHMHFVLPSSSPAGTYRVQVRDKDNRSYQGHFTVHEYKLEPVRLTIDTERTVFYRGEEIEGTITAEFYYGAPLAGREIRYQLSGNRLHTAKTDAKGQVKFKLATREFREDQTLTLSAVLPERNIGAAANFRLATKGFSVAVKTLRPVYVSGETFDATITTTSTEGKPIGRKLTLHVLEKTTVNRRHGERSVEKHELETDEKTGEGRLTLKLEKGATYILRAEGTDRFENLITGQHDVRVSDDSDDVRLRILANRHSFKVGDTAAVQLHWREKPALALITFQGARILDYKLVVLRTGANKLPIPMVAKLAPNFELAVAVMTDARGEKDKNGKTKPVKRFHAAASQFTVARDLRVSLSVRRADKKDGPVRPGEEVEVTVTTTDPQGKPVAAELSLAMVEQSLLARYGANVAAIDQFFRGQRRETAVRTTSSVVFSYRPSTKAINSRLLAERDRIELEGEERERLAVRDEDRPTSSADLFAGDSIAPPAPDTAVGGHLEANLRFAVPSDPRLSGPAGTLSRGGRRKAEGQGQGYGLGGGAGQGGGNSSLLRLHDKAKNGIDSDTRADRNGVANRPGWARWKGENDYEDDKKGDGQWGTTFSLYAAEKLAQRGVRELTIVTGSGKQHNVQIISNGEFDEKHLMALGIDLEKDGAVILPNFNRQETGYWNPAVVTDAKGKATLTFTMPERSTAWKLLAKGITTETLAGEAETELVVKKDLFGQLKLPLAFTDGDEAVIPVSVHNSTLKKGTITVTLKITIGDRSTTETKKLEVTKTGILDLNFKAVLKRPAADKKADEKEKADKNPAAAGPNVRATFELTVSAGETTDVQRRLVPVQPYGVPVFTTAGGSSTSDISVWLEGPKDMPLASRSMQILVGPTVERSLLDVVFAPAPWCQVEVGRVASGLDRTSSDLMAALALQKLLGKTQQAGGPQVQSLDSRIRGAISQLVSSQRSDGGWSWTGRGGGSNRYSTARVVWALALAKQAGYSVPTSACGPAKNFLQSQIAKTSNTDYESKAVLLHALAVEGQGDFALANRIHRNRQSLSGAALSHLALALVVMDRKVMAAEALKVMADRKLGGADAAAKFTAGVLPWNRSGVELRALYALALQQVTPKDATAKKLVDWLMAHRTGHRWSPEKATGPAMLAACEWFAASRFKGEHYTLSVFVNDFRAKVLEIKDDTGTVTIDVPARLFKKEGKQRVNFQITGRGRFTFQCIYGGFVDADKLKSTTKAWTANRYYQPAPRMLDGKEIPRGFGGVLQGSYTSFRNPLTELPVAERGQIELVIRRANTSSTIRDEQLDYLVVTEPLPAGATVIESSISGGFDRYEISPGAITFYVGGRRHIGTIRYDVHGYVPGKYRVIPTLIRDAYRPADLAVSTTKSLTVLPMGSESGDKYRLSPVELYELGKRRFAKKEYKLAGAHLRTLWSSWNLSANVYKDTARMLLDVHLELGPPAEVVKYFEIIKEKLPELEISFAKMVRMASAYHEMGEYERSFLIYRSTVEASFQRESGVGGFLESQGEFTRSVNFMKSLLREYPPEPYIAAATYALAQRVYAKAPKAASDPKLREKKIHRVDLVRSARAMLEDFLMAHPEDPAADQAAFSIANALLELKDYKRAIVQCDRYAKLYATGDFLDSYWFVIGYCHFALSQHKEALAMCRKVADHKRINRASGREEDSRNKWQAVYILGQVFHSLNEAAKAIVEYKRVETRFPDAKQAIDYFARKDIRLPEVTTIKPGEKGEVVLKFRNVASCDTKVYRIDLMKFSLLRRNLAGITRINLAGIRPHHEESIKLGDGKDYRDRTRTLSLPLKAEGAYLVVCRGGDLHTSGLVLVSPLVAEIQEDATSGRVRTTIRDVAKDQYVSDVHVKVIGSSNPEFTSGETDLRGVFVADAISGTSTVIAQADGNRYAFFRGKTHLGSPPRPQSKATPKKPAAAQPSGGKEKLIEQLQMRNFDLQQEQVDELKKLYKNAPSGVKAEAAY